MKMRELAKDELQKMSFTPERIADFIAFFDKTDPVAAAEEVPADKEEAAREAIRFAMSVPQSQLDTVLAQTEELKKKILDTN